MHSRVPLDICNARLDPCSQLQHILTYLGIIGIPMKQSELRCTNRRRGHALFTNYRSSARIPAKRRLILSLLSKLSQAGGKTQLEEQLINGTQVRDAPLMAMYVASGANLPQRSLLLSLSLHSTPNSQRPGIEVRGSNLVSSLRPWARQHAGKGRIGG